MRRIVPPPRIHSAAPLAAALLAVGFLCAGPLDAQTAGFSLRASPSAVAPGESVLISVVLENADPPVTIDGAQVGLSFDTAIYTLTGFETPDVLAGGVATDFFTFNGPPPVGTGGTSGCTYWWDGVGLDTVSAVMIFSSGGVMTEESLLFRFELTVHPSAPLGATTITHAAPDSTCLWNGSLIVGDNFGTSIPDLSIHVSEVAGPIDLECGSAAGTVYLGWSSPEAYSSILVHRDGTLVSTLPGSATQFIDNTTSQGTEYDYDVRGVLGGLESPADSCTLTASNPPTGSVALTCADLGGAAGMSWTVAPLPWSTIEVRRNGAFVAMLPGSATSFIDGNPPALGTPILYQLTWTLGVTPGAVASCTVVVNEIDPVVEFIRGDTNRDGNVDIADAVATLNYLFAQGPLTCADAADKNDDGNLDISDPVSLAQYLFSGGPPPPSPFPAVGPDPTDDALGCDS